MQIASFSLAEVTYITGDISFQVRESVKAAQLKVRAKSENVSGVQLPAFDMFVDGSNGKEERKLVYYLFPPHSSHSHQRRESIHSSFILFGF